LESKGWGTRKGPKVPRAAHKGGERTLGYKGTKSKKQKAKSKKQKAKSKKQIPRPAHPITRKNGARWGPRLRAS
jgi:hypothetical protein